MPASMQQPTQSGVLEGVVARVLAAAGSSAQEARTVAANLVLANLSGHDSHGVGMLPRYVDAVLEGGLKPNTGVAIQLDIGSMLALDGQRGYGQVLGKQAMALGIERARQHGSCIMTLANAESAISQRWRWHRIWCRCILSASGHVPSWRRGVELTADLALIRAASVYPYVAANPFCWTLPLAVLHRGKCGWPITRACRPSAEH